ncbi:MAG: gamma-glutamyl-gamma-aminobutyrate hydrolase family protein [Blautia sp.]|nr:gamma-glutamyl-gamma-aminobutyrate hydrolase family protein [Blautia sp.]
MYRPRIALPEMNQNMGNYLRALNAAGLDPVVIAIGKMETESCQSFLDFSRFHVGDFDGLFLPGGGDIDPLCYGCKNEGMCYSITDTFDDMELAMTDAFVREGKPILGICRGHQLLNVYFGGSLIQHLPTYEDHVRRPGGYTDSQHWVLAEEDSWLAKLYGREFSVNSSHHQAVDRLGTGLVIDCRSKADGVVEALHHENLPIYGVQWHPERMCLDKERADTVNGLPVLRHYRGLFF